MADSDVVKLMIEAGKKEQYQETIDYLMSQRALPPVKRKYLGEEISGEFERNTIFGKDLPSTGQINLNYGAGADTLGHEMTHAAQKRLNNQYIQEKFHGPGLFRKSDTNFTDTYEKLVSNYEAEKGKSDQIQNLIQRLAPQTWIDKYKNYRASSAEAQAHAVGNTMKPDSTSFRTVAPAHLDATLATEYMILLDAAKRSNVKKPTTDKR